MLMCLGGAPRDGAKRGPELVRVGSATCMLEQQMQSSEGGHVTNGLELASANYGLAAYFCK